MVDVSKIKVGDEVTVRLIVLCEERAFGVACRSGAGTRGYTIDLSDIVGHTPKPREIKVGDSVIRPMSSSRHVWEVMAVSGQRAWLTSGEIDIVVQVSTLIHAP